MMRLFYTPTSPYARKVLIVAMECGLDARLERVVMDPWAADSGVAQYGPLGKVPVLETKDAGILFDSPVICEFLDGLHAGPSLYPADGDARWRARRMQALADGVLDAAVLWRLETMRPQAQRSSPWCARQLAAVRRSVDFLERHVDDITGPVTIGHVGVGCALGYLDFRVSAEDWRAQHPRLAAWYSDWAQRPSMRATEPPSG